MFRINTSYEHEVGKHQNQFRADVTFMNEVVYSVWEKTERRAIESAEAHLVSSMGKLLNP